MLLGKISVAVGGYGPYNDWNMRGYRDFMFRRPFGGYRGGYNHFHSDWHAYQDRLEDRYKHLTLHANPSEILFINYN